jgi:hypothetical protein
LLEVERDNWWQAIDVLGKAMVIYLAILAALIGYILTTTLDATVQRVLLLSAIFVSLAYGTVNAFALRSLVPHMKLVHSLSVRLAKAAEIETEAARLYASRRHFATVGVLAAFSVGALFVGILFYLLLRA